MKKRPAEPIPVVDLPREHELARLAVLVESAMQEPPAGLPQVKWRIRSTLRRQAEWRRRLLRLSLAGVLFFLAGGVVGAVVQPILYSRLQGSASPGADPYPAPSRPRRSHNRRYSPPSAQESPAAISEVPVAEVPAAASATTTPTGLLGTSAAPTVLGAAPSKIAATASPRVARESGTPFPRLRAPLTLPAPPPTEAPSEASIVGQAPALDTALVMVRTARPSPTSPTDGAAPAGPVPLAASPLPKQPEVVAAGMPAPPAEQALLGKALQRLRLAHDPGAALALLDQYTARFPSGTLAPEAARLRTEALLVAGRKDVVLAELERQADTLPASDERRLLRGELRAGAGRWRAAFADFDAVMHSFSQGALAEVKALECFERALWGRAVARSHLADQAGARADLADYLRRFPSGRFAAEATRLANERR